MGNLINDTLNAFILEVESLKDISEVETHQLHHLLSLPLNQIPLLFVIGKEKTQVSFPQSFSFSFHSLNIETNEQ